METETEMELGIIATMKNIDALSSVTSKATMSIIILITSVIDLGLVDSGASGSLGNKELAEFTVELQKNPTKWNTTNGVIQMDGSVIIENYNLP